MALGAKTSKSGSFKGNERQGAKSAETVKRTAIARSSKVGCILKTCSKYLEMGGMQVMTSEGPRGNEAFDLQRECNAVWPWCHGKAVDKKRGNRCKPVRGLSLLFDIRKRAIIQMAGRRGEEH